MTVKGQNEQAARMRIDRKLLDSHWILPGYEDKGKVNIDPEFPDNRGKPSDYMLFDNDGFPLCLIEAKSLKNGDPLFAKKQAKEYAESLKVRFIILSNGLQHYFWDRASGNPQLINEFPSQKQLELRKEKFEPAIDGDEEISNNYIGLTQNPNFEEDPDFKDVKKRQDYLIKNKIKILRDYQLKAVHSIKHAIKTGKDRFLLEMATGTGKTLTACAIIKMFLRLYKVKRVLFLVDRLELETQAQRDFDEVLKNDYTTIIWKERQSNWNQAEIVVSTIQSLINKNKYKTIFNHDDFDLVISDEAHRSLGLRGRKVFEYFNGYKLGLTATPKDFLKGVDLDKLGELDPRGVEKRMILDTYTTFGCENSEPTFRYSLEDGVKDGHLVNPHVLDARTDITTELLSEQGYSFVGVDEDGNDVEEIFIKKDFEKRFFSVETNTMFCETFFKKAKKDPFTGEIGKTLVFCVSQNHALKITQILNQIADKYYPGVYRSDFASQVTSNVDDAQQMTIGFKNNNLNGISNVNPNYLTSKTRVCVTVGMMTTGYDCPDILNICLMRPVYSPSEFVQMKGRGTRKNDFKLKWISPEEMPTGIESKKNKYSLFDFFGNYQYFESDFDYDEKLILPKEKNGKPINPRPLVADVVTYQDDPLRFLEEIKIGSDGMKIDRELYKSFKTIVNNDEDLKELVNSMRYDDAEKYLKENILEKTQENYTLEKLRQSLGIDRNLTTPELLNFALGYTNKIKSKSEVQEEEFVKFENTYHIKEEFFDAIKLIFDSYLIDEEFRYIIDSKKLSELNVHPSGDAYASIPKEFRDSIPEYIRENVNLERLV